MPKEFLEIGSGDHSLEGSVETRDRVRRILKGERVLIKVWERGISETSKKVSTSGCGKVTIGGPKVTICKTFRSTFILAA